MESSVTKKMMQSLAETNFYAIEADEATDSANKSILMWPLLLTWFNFNPSMDK